MQLISSDEQVRQNIPNVLVTVQGEPSLLEKLTPFIEQAEGWLAENFTSAELLQAIAAEEGTPLKSLCTRIVITEAFRTAVPSLDVILTPNGFGIVSNQNVAPASRDRVARLIASLETSRDNSIEQLIGYLFRIEEWWQSAARQWFTATLFPNIDLANLCGYNDHRWSNYLGLRSKCIDIEQRIAEEFISPEQLAVLREEVFSMSWDFSLTASCHTQIIERLRSVIVSALQGNTLNIQSLRDIVDFMRKHDEQFPEFRSSRTYKLFEPPIFENKKEIMATGSNL
jgi:hypothetical protein